ncbi:hypothetical protein [Bradyrhizobium valentinum]|uniref:Uncharacterized protein n=1 Tax=Bradyrhizobium valentinum TaxID=1518501 RepID=A0A0R3LW50_9BRAD|nr:hypothetical protein [Bradyrhizobium valentinum]KRR12185.1 hypothetical protein CP49_36180 [Bradyrhizobium valentinum]
MKMKSVSLGAFALASTAALAQGNTVGGNSQAGGRASKEHGRQCERQHDDRQLQAFAEGRQHAGTAGAVDRKGDAPGGTMKK